MALTVFVAFVWFLCIFERTGCQTIHVRNGTNVSAVVSRFCPHSVAADVNGATRLMWTDVYYRQLALPGANHVVQHVQGDHSEASLTFNFVMESQDVMLVATSEDGITTLIFQVDVVAGSGPIEVAASSGDSRQADPAEGGAVNVTCTVTTCRRMGYVVEVVGRGNRTLQVWNGTFERGVESFTFGMPVSPDSLGEYKCVAKATLNGQIFVTSSVASLTGAAEGSELPRLQGSSGTASPARHHVPSSILVSALASCSLLLCTFLLQRVYSV